jgi:hypothetical protein
MAWSVSDNSRIVNVLIVAVVVVVGIVVVVVVVVVVIVEQLCRYSLRLLNMMQALLFLHVECKCQHTEKQKIDHNQRSL